MASRSPIKLMSIVGARPQFIKLAPLLNALSAHNEANDSRLRIEHTTLHTGQHYDADMSDIFFEELEIPPADINLGIGSGSHGKQTGSMLAGIEEALLKQRPDLLIVFGDTNSTLAGALAAAKLQIPVAHVEAGLRSFNRSMPEEINRITADHLSDILLAPTATAVAHLSREGLAEKTWLTGDIMYDTVLRNIDLAARKSQLLQEMQLAPKSYYLATVHRAENTDHQDKLLAIMRQLNEIATDRYPVVFPMHPRTKNRIKQLLPDWAPGPSLKIISPVGYLDILQLVQGARVALTDSGGLQKEVFFLNCPCITLREETEWVETISAGGNVLTGADPGKIKQAIEQWEQQLNGQTVDFSDQVRLHYGEGNTSERILQRILAFLQ